MAEPDAPKVELDDELEKQELIQSEADESDETPPSDIVAFNELRSCSDLKRLHDAGQLEIQPNYQREDVWQPAQQTRFVDSLAKQLPIPSMCISLDYKTDKRQIVDGLQRISTIIKFLGDEKWRLSNLEEVDSRISNKTVDHIKSTYPDIYSRIEKYRDPGNRPALRSLQEESSGISIYDLPSPEYRWNEVEQSGNPELYLQRAIQ